MNFLKLFQKEKPTYPAWWEEAPTVISEEQFKKAWEIITRCSYEKCNIKVVSSTPVQLTLAIQTTKRMLIRGFGRPASMPVLKEGQDFYYSGCGCTFDTDANNNRFQLINKQTNKPEDEEAYSEEIVVRYFKQNQQKLIK